MQSEIPVDEDGLVSFVDVIENVSMMVMIYKQLEESEAQQKAEDEELAR